MSQPDAFAYSADELKNLASDILARARQAGASDCQVNIGESFGHIVNIRQGSLDTLEYTRDKGLSITAYRGHKTGSASTSDFSTKAVEDTVKAAISIAGFTAEDPFNALPEAHLLATTMQELELYHPWAIDVSQSIALASETEAAAFAHTPKISNSEGANVGTQQSQGVYASSNGFLGYEISSRHDIGCSVIAGQDDKMQRDGWYDSRRDAKELASAQEIGNTAAKRALSRLGARQIKTAKVPVVFDATVAQSILGHFVYAASGASLYRKTSFLVDQLGQQVFSNAINIIEDPWRRRAFGSGSFDGEGVATAPRKVVEDGRLNGYFLSSYSARKLGLQTTGNAGGSHYLELQATTGGLADILKQMGRGLLVTDLIGQGINYVNGDYSRGVAGFWVENGEIAHAVEEITVAGNLRDMFKNISAVGNDGLNRGAKKSGSIVIEGMTIAGN